MCNKMFKNYVKFIQDFQESDQMLKVISNTCSTVAYKLITDNPDPNAMAGIATLTPGQICPSTHGIALILGPRRNTKELNVVDISSDEYNNLVRSRMTTNATTETRSFAWRNFIIDRGLVPTFLEKYEMAIRNNILQPYHSYLPSLASFRDATSRYIQPTHERMVAA